jgi:hypothetical protein
MGERPWYYYCCTTIDCMVEYYYYYDERASWHMHACMPRFKRGACVTCMHHEEELPWQGPPL